MELTSGFRCHLILSCLVVAGYAWAAPPSAPTALTVVPIYGVNQMRLEWQDNSANETGFRIERRTAGSSFSSVGTVAAGVQDFTDVAVSPDIEYTYRIAAYNADGDAFSKEDKNEISITWALSNGAHNMLNSWQDGSPNNVWGFHEGIDIMDDGQGGQTVVAARGGIISFKKSGDPCPGDNLAIQTLQGTQTLTDLYCHLQNLTAKVVGDSVSPGEKIGEISTTAYPAGSRHVHQMLIDGGYGLPADGNTFRNPFSIFTLPADQDPGGFSPSLEDWNGDGKLVLYKRSDNSYFSSNTIYGDVNISAEITDAMGTNPRAGVHRAGYWIEGLPPASEPVRSAATPYLLHDFTIWFGHEEKPNPRPNFDAVYDPDQVTTHLFPKRFHHLLTHTKGTDGTVANLDSTQVWRTDAQKGSPGSEPNGTGAPRARENQEAKFPDGTYYVHVVMADMLHTVDSAQTTVTDNSRPYVTRVTVYSGAQIVYHAKWVWDTTTAQLALQPATFDGAAPFSALRTQDIAIEVEFSEPMQTAAITAITPLGHVLTLTSAQPAGARTVWKGIVSNLDIDDSGADDGVHMITITGTDLAGNSLLQIHDRSNMPADHHNRDASGNLRGTAGTDNIHGFKIGPPAGVIPVTAIFMKQTVTDPTTPLISDRAGAIQQALNSYFSEVSYSYVSFSVTSVGWYQLNHPLNWYYTKPQSALVDLVQEAVTAADGAGMLPADRRYVLVVTDETAARDEWSTTGGWPYNVAASPGWRLICAGTTNLASSNAHLTNLAGRWIGLIDLYAYPEVTVSKPFVGPWSHMSDKEHEVHPMGWEKWRAGWLDETGTATSKMLTRVAKPTVASPIVDQTYTLLPIDKSDNGTKMVAVATADRLQYTAEYRRQQNKDSALPDSGVLIVKANDAVNQGEGPAIVQESSVTAGDLSDATFNLTPSRTVFDDAGSGVKIEVTSITTDQAQIKLNYKLPPKENDVYVAPHDERWKTEDIWIDAPDLAGNFAADPLSVKDTNEKPVVGKVNKVYARVRNKGHADATNFEVHLEIREPWAVGGPWRSLKVENIVLLKGQDNDPNAYALVSADWTPSGDVHSCVQVTITGVANDVNSENNWTQENISEFTTTQGSPYKPVTTNFEVENPYTDALPIFFNVDGLPPGWTYILSPERLLLTSKEVGKVRVTVQPVDSAPLCTREQVTISAFAPRMDTLKRLGAITMQIGLKNAANVTIKSAVDCSGREGKEVSTVAVENTPVTSWCTISTQGCTDPKLANQRIAVIYTDPSGTPQVHYVTTDANGCYSDTLTGAAGGLWQTQAVLEETDCRAEARSPSQPAPTAGAPGFNPRNWRYFVAFGPSFPLGEFGDLFDPGFSLSLGGERALRQNLSAVGVFGVHQFYSTAQNRHVLQAGLNLKYAFFQWPDKFAYVQAGASWYRPQGGSNGGGGNFGAGLQWTLTPKLALDLHADYHRFQSTIGRLDGGSFVTLQLGVVWSH